MPVAVTGLRELQAAFAKTGRDSRLGVRKEIRQIAEPIRSTAETNTAGAITRIGPRWPKMRIGVSRSLIYVAPRQRGVKVKGGTRMSRPNLGNLLMEQMESALRQHEHQIEANVERALDRICDQFNRG